MIPVSHNLANLCIYSSLFHVCKQYSYFSFPIVKLTELCENSYWEDESKETKISNLPSLRNNNAIKRDSVNFIVSQ